MVCEAVVFGTGVFNRVVPQTVVCGAEAFEPVVFESGNWEGDI